MKNIEIKFYCSKCGKSLVNKLINERYSVLTGKKLYEYLWQCPNKRFYNSHTKFITDVNGSSYPYEI